MSNVISIKNLELIEWFLQNSIKHLGEDFTIKELYDLVHNDLCVELTKRGATC